MLKNQPSSKLPGGITYVPHLKPPFADHLSLAIVLGVLLNSALYLGCVFVAALVERNHAAEYSAITAFGITYLSYLMQLAKLPLIAIQAVVAASVGLGVAAGLALLIF